jgi:hypothetical protein
MDKLRPSKCDIVRNASYSETRGAMTANGTHVGVVRIINDKF